MKETIRIEDMRLFASVAEARSFTGAAARLGIPKQTISRRIADLERALEVRNAAADGLLPNPQTGCGSREAASLGDAREEPHVLDSDCLLHGTPWLELRSLSRPFG